MLQTLVASGASQCLSSYTGSRQIVSSAVRPQSLAIRKTLSQSGSHPTHTVVSQLASRRHLAGPISAAAFEESTAVEGEEPAEEVSEEEQLYFEDDDELVMYIKVHRSSLIHGHINGKPVGLALHQSYNHSRSTFKPPSCVHDMTYYLMETDLKHHF